MKYFSNVPFAVTNVVYTKVVNMLPPTTAVHFFCDFDVMKNVSGSGLVVVVGAVKLI